MVTVGPARHALHQRLDGPERITLLSASAGSGKTFLLRSWIDHAWRQGQVAWLSVRRDESDAMRFWLSVRDALCETAAGSKLIRTAPPAPELDGWAFVDQLLEDLGSPEAEPIWLVIDDLHELRAGEALRQLERFLMRVPPLVRPVLATRHDPPLGLHRLRLEGELNEVREHDLRFSREEARELFDTAGLAISDSALAVLHARTEGWAAGLRFAALALAGHPEPERFVAEFSGTERTIAEYLLAEVLERQPDEVRRFLLRTSILFRVNGAVADVLAGTSGGEAILHKLEASNAFVVPLDAERSWFRYHTLFADVLRLELRRTEPEAVEHLHRTAARWHEQHGHVLEAMRHALAARDWPYARRLLADTWVGLELDGHGASVRRLLAAFPAAAASDPELAAVHAAHQAQRGSLDDAYAYVALSERHAASVPASRRRRFERALGLARLAIARRRGDLESMAEEVPSLLAPVVAETASDVAFRNDVRALALLNLGIVEQWSLQTERAVAHIEQALDVARLNGRPYIEISCLGHLALADVLQGSFAMARKRSTEAVAIAEAHGWAAEPIAAVPWGMLASVATWQGRFEEAEHWFERSERALLRAELEPAFGVSSRLARGRLLVAQGRLEQALASFRSAERLEALLDMRHALVGSARLYVVLANVRLGDLATARATLARMPAREHESGEMRAAAAAVHLAGGDAEIATELIAPVLDGSARLGRDATMVQALIVDAIARDALGDDRAAEIGIERALASAESEAVIWPFVMTPPTDLLERHPRHRTAHAALLNDILDVLAGSSVPRGAPPGLREPLSNAELRVLRHLPSNLSAPEIGRELYVSASTVKTHMSRIYAKLGVHRRSDAVERARELGLLSRSLRTR